MVQPLQHGGLVATSRKHPHLHRANPVVMTTTIVLKPKQVRIAITRRTVEGGREGGRAGCTEAVQPGRRVGLDVAVSEASRLKLTLVVHTVTLTAQHWPAPEPEATTARYTLEKLPSSISSPSRRSPTFMSRSSGSYVFFWGPQPLGMPGIDLSCSLFLGGERSGPRHLGFGWASWGVSIVVRPFVPSLNIIIINQAWYV